MKRFIYLILAIQFTGCAPIDKRFPIWIINNSNKVIYFLVSTKYPDTTFTQINYDSYLLNPGAKISYDSNQPWDEVFTAKFPKDTFLIFFFNSDTINKYDWETIRSKYKIMERRALSKSNLKNSDWKITYP